MKGAVYLCTDCFGMDSLIKAKMKVCIIISIIIFLSFTLTPPMIIQVDYKSFTGDNHLQVTNKLVPMIKLQMTIEGTATMN